MANKQVLAMDYGASSGRGIVGSFDGKSLSLKEVHRFSNNPVDIGSIHWDVLRLYHELKETLSICNSIGGVDSLAIDTWGVDYGLLDENDELIGNPFHYRDSRTSGFLKIIDEVLSFEDIYKITGIYPMELNTLVQLYSHKKNNSKSFESIKTVLLMPDLLGFFLTGEKVSEYSIASTTQLLDAKKRNWSDKIVKKFFSDDTLFSPVVSSGARVGSLRKNIIEELWLSKAPALVTACGHDTQNAMLSVPSSDEDFVFISCGTWALFGTELSEPILSLEAMKKGFSNEGGFNNKISFLKNIIGTWLIQESRKQWSIEGKNYSFAELDVMAEKESCGAVIDPNASEFVAPGDIPGRIKEFCRKTKQQVPQTPGQIVRCIYDSLAMAYKEAFIELSEITGKTFDKVHMIGGGTQSKLLCRVSANAIGVPIVAGPVEATVIGNLLIQLISSGELRDVKEARKLVLKMDDIAVYEPEGCDEYKEKYEKYINVKEKI